MKNNLNLKIPAVSRRKKMKKCWNFKGKNPSEVEIGRCTYLFCSIIWVRKWNLFFNFKLYLYIKQNFSISSFFSSWNSRNLQIQVILQSIGYLFINTSNMKISRVIKLEYGNESVDLGSWKKMKKCWNFVLCTNIIWN